MLRGKLAADKLKELVLPYLGAPNERVLLPPRLGEDAAVINLGSAYMVAASDPITGAIDNIGMYAVNINANDIACTGAVPEFFLSVVLLPSDFRDEDVRRIAQDISREAEKINVSIIGGHTESLSIETPIVVGTMIGFTNKVITTAGAQMGDDIILTKGAAMEGTCILARDFYDVLCQKVDARTLKKAQGFLSYLSVVEEALIAKEYATAMHDPTEGGIQGGLHELADASSTGFHVDTRKVPISGETDKICSAMNVNPLKLISSGALLITASKKHSHRLMEKLKKAGIRAEIIGEITQGRNLDPVEQDELWPILAELDGDHSTGHLD